MKSPFTGGEVSLNKEVVIVNIDEEKVKILHHYYLCNDSKERFTTEKLDTINYNQAKKAQRKYRKTNLLDDNKNNALSF